jgi:hypothetical protein
MPFDPELELGLELANLNSTPNGNGFGAAMSSLLWNRLWNGDEDVATPSMRGAGVRCAQPDPDPDPPNPDPAPNGNRFGAAMSSSPWDRIRNGDEDVATPFHSGVLVVKPRNHGSVKLNVDTP